MIPETSERMGLYAVEADQRLCRHLETRLSDAAVPLRVRADSDPSLRPPADIASRFDCLLVGPTLPERTALALVRGVRDADAAFPVVAYGGVEHEDLRTRVDAVVERTTGSDHYSRLARCIERAATPETRRPPAAVDDISYALGPDGRLTDWNDTLNDVTGRSDEALGRVDPLVLVAPADRDAVRGAIGRCLGEGSTTVTARVLEADGGTRTYEMRAVLVTDGERPLAICGVARDVAAGTPDREAFEQRHSRLKTAASDPGGLSGVVSD